MIEVIEKVLLSSIKFGEYKKAWIVMLQDLGGSYKVIILLSKTAFPFPVSKKRWRLDSRFLREGCYVHRSSLPLFNKKGRKKYWLSSDEIIRIGNITDKNLIEELKRVDNTEKELRLNP